MQSLVNKEVLKTFTRRIDSIDIDYVEFPGFVQELIQDKKFSLFPRMLVTERVDRIRANLMDYCSHLLRAIMPGSYFRIRPYLF
ncbi:spore germination protein [Sutcliffiella horikoshii]|uniref:Spore germination protein n=1 Tax=Sutcliffiella horikoshii TaxID=79883 RepID=A0A5D4SX14_9BACI|nr:spore germination protein [Sutcliffiella horikoshii]